MRSQWSASPTLETSCPRHSTNPTARRRRRIPQPGAERGWHPPTRPSSPSLAPVRLWHGSCRKQGSPCRPLLRLCYHQQHCRCCRYQALPQRSKARVRHPRALLARTLPRAAPTLARHTQVPATVARHVSSAAPWLSSQPPDVSMRCPRSLWLSEGAVAEHAHPRNSPRADASRRTWRSATDAHCPANCACSDHNFDHGLMWLSWHGKLHVRGGQGTSAENPCVHTCSLNAQVAP